MPKGPAASYAVCIRISAATEKRRRELLALLDCTMPVLLDRALIALEKHPEAGNEASTAA
jgi:hypothetical protein